MSVVALLSMACMTLILVSREALISAMHALRKITASAWQLTMTFVHVCPDLPVACTGDTYHCRWLSCCKLSCSAIVVLTAEDLRIGH